MKAWILVATMLFCGCAQQLTPDQIQTLAATTAATIAIAGNTTAALHPKNAQQIQVITDAAAQATQLVGAAAQHFTPTPTPTATPKP